MQAELITVSAFCTYHHTEPSFIEALAQNGLITVTQMAEERYIHYDQLQELECYTRWFYDMDINIGGIDAMHNMLQRLQEAYAEINALKEKLKLYDSRKDAEV